MPPLTPVRSGLTTPEDLLRRTLRRGNYDVGSGLRSALRNEELLILAADDGPDSFDAVNPRAAVEVTLNGLGNAYLDSEFARMVENFEELASSDGVTIRFLSGYRTPAYQQYMRENGIGRTPATNSLHSAGLAVDVNLENVSDDEFGIIRDAAEAAGLSWGGSFNDPDRPHFYYDPGGDRPALIAHFGSEVERLQRGIPRSR